MTTILAVCGALGGLTAFATLCWLTLKAIFKMVNATDNNTAATNRLTEAVDELRKNMNDHERRISLLEDHDRVRRGTERTR